MDCLTREREDPTDLDFSIGTGVSNDESLRRFKFRDIPPPGVAKIGKIGVFFPGVVVVGMVLGLLGV